MTTLPGEISRGTQTAPSTDQASRLRELARSLRPERSVGETDESSTGATVARLAPLVTITSGKGGVGKTNIAVNLAVELARPGCRVTLLDADLGLANADLLCGLTPTTRLDSTLTDERRRTLLDIAVTGPAGIRLVPGAVGVPRMAELQSVQRAQLLSQLAALQAASDIVLIDTGAGIGASVLFFIGAADLAMIVSTPETTSIADAYALLKASGPMRKEGGATGLLVNRATVATEAKATYDRVAMVASRFLPSVPAFLGMVHEDQAVVQAVKARTPFVLGAPASQASRDIGQLARGLRERFGIGPFAASIHGQPGFWSRLWRGISR
jgi:flagellar biosynthesis protein FlhG